MEGQSKPGEEFRWTNTKLNQRTQRILGAIVGAILIVVIVLAHTPVLAFTRYSPLYFLLYFYLVILLVDVLFGRQLVIVVNQEGLQVRMPRFGGREGGALPSPLKTVSFNLSWGEIKQVRISERRVIVTTRYNAEHEFTLLYLNYRATRKLKNTLRSLAKSHGVPVRV